MDKRDLVRIIKAIIIAVVILCLFELKKSESIIESQIDHSDEPVSEEKVDKETWEELLDAFSSGSGRIMLSQVTEALDGENIQYTGYYNQSLERIDMTLEDGTELLFLSATGSEGENMGYELMMVNEELDSDCFQEDYLNEYDVTTDEFYYPKRLLSGSYLDLDKDGQREQIIYRILEEDSTGYFAFEAELCIRGAEGEISKVFHGEGLWTECFVASMGDQYIYLIVSDYGDSADYTSTFYRYDRGSLANVGNMLSHPAAIMFDSDRIMGKEREYHFQTQEIEKEYAFESGKLVSQEKDYYEYTKNIVTVDQKIALYTEKDESDATIMIFRGDEVQVMGGDLKQWVQLKKVSTGEVGWLKVNENDICCLADGTEISAWDLFEDRIIYD